MKSYFYQVILVALIVSGCEEDARKNEILFNDIKKQQVKNYEDKKSQFNRFEDYFKFKQIKYIEFIDDSIVTIWYKPDNDTSKVQAVEKQNIRSASVEKVLSIEGLAVKDMFDLRDRLRSIDVNSLWLIDNYDALKGMSTREIELKYAKKMNGLRFFYRIYEKPLDSMGTSSHNTLLQNNTTGGKLGEKVIWYYRR